MIKHVLEEQKPTRGQYVTCPVYILPWNKNKLPNKDQVVLQYPMLHFKSSIIKRKSQFLLKNTGKFVFKFFRGYRLKILIVHTNLLILIKRDALKSIRIRLHCCRRFERMQYFIIKKSIGLKCDRSSANNCFSAYQLQVLDQFIYVLLSCLSEK